MAQHDECSGDRCGYRRLYEGSQVSLADMASRQGAALGRVGRLRGAIATALRRNFPDLSSKAEQQLGARLADIDDEILIAYMEAFIASAITGMLKPPIEGLRAALRVRGVVVQGDDLDLWVSQIAGASTTPASAVESTAGQQPAAGAPNPNEGSRPALLSASPSSTGPERPPSAASWAEKESPPLGSIFADAANVKLWEGDLGRNGDNSTWTPSPVAARASGNDARDNGESGEQEKPHEGATADAVHQSSKGGTKHKSARSKEPDDGDRGKRTGGPPEKRGKRQTPERTERDRPVLPQEAASQDDTAERRGAKDARNAVTELETTREPRAQTGIPGLKPEIFEQPAGRKKRQPKQLRLQAEAPAEAIPAIAQEAPLVTLDAGTKEALLAAASIPRPVFIRDLVGITGDPAVVEAWERECRADPANNPVRFIAPKMRHRARGALVFGDSNKAASASPDTWWGKCISTYRGAKLYELAVLLHRIGDQIVSHRFAGDIATLRLNTGKGLSGTLVVFDTELDAGSAVREELGKALEELLSERLVLISVLTTSAENGSLEGLSSCLEELAREKNYKPAAPVVAARTWEYADDRGSTSVLVLGNSS